MGALSLHFWGRDNEVATRRQRKEATHEGMRVLLSAALEQEVAAQGNLERYPEFTMNHRFLFLDAVRIFPQLAYDSGGIRE